MPAPRAPSAHRDAQGQAGGLWPSVAELLNKHLCPHWRGASSTERQEAAFRTGRRYPPAAREVPGSAPGRSGPEPAAPGLVGCREAQKGGSSRKQKQLPGALQTGLGQKRPQPRPSSRAWSSTSYRPFRLLNSHRGNRTCERKLNNLKLAPKIGVRAKEGVGGEALLRVWFIKSLRKI